MRALAIFLFATIVLMGCASEGVRPRPWTSTYDVTTAKSLRDKQDHLILVTMRDEDHDDLLHGGVIGRDDALPPRYASFVADLARRFDLRRVADWPLMSLDIRCLVFAAPDAASRAAIVRALADEPRVESAQILQAFRTASDSLPRDYNDPYLAMQHSLREMQIRASHQYSTGKGVRVAVIDTGVDTGHPDLAERVVVTRNYVDRSGSTFRRDIHGTAVAGVIAAAANNATGIVGVAPEADILAVKACRQLRPDQQAAECTSFSLAKALDFAIQQEAQVINLSLAGPPDPILERLVRKAIERDILVVGAGDPRRPGEFPANVEGVIAVGETGPRYRSAGDSRWVHAPGTKVISAFPEERYEFYDGSSLATAHITGIGALIRQRKPHLPADAVRALLTATAESESGAANGCRAIARLVSGARCPQPQSAARN